jgi:hypothetical protein
MSYLQGSQPTFACISDLSHVRYTPHPHKPLFFHLQSIIWYTKEYYGCSHNIFFSIFTLSQQAHAFSNSSIYFYSKTNKIHKISNLFYFGTTLYMFRTVFPSIIRSLRLYIQLQVCHTGSVVAAADIEHGKRNLRYCVSCWFYYRNILRCTVLQTSKKLNLRFHLTAGDQALSPYFLI